MKGICIFQFAKFLSLSAIKIVFAAALICISVQIPANAQTANEAQLSKSAQKIIKRGDRLSVNGQHLKAIKYFQSRLQRDDLTDFDKYAIQKRIVDRYVRLGEMEKAEAVLLAIPINNSRINRRLIRFYINGYINNKQFEPAYHAIKKYNYLLNPLQYSDYQKHLLVLARTNRIDELKETSEKYTASHSGNRERQTKLLQALNAKDRKQFRLYTGYAIFPGKATRSGKCSLLLSISATGEVSSIDKIDCSEPLFEENSITAANQNFYLPKLENGIPIATTGVKFSTTFKLHDDKGRLIPSKE